MLTPEEEIQIFNRDQVQMHIPAIIYTVSCMLIGFVGNVLVIFFYGIKLRATPTYLLIVTLAVYDVAACLTLMPFHLYKLSNEYSFEDEGLCRLLVFVSYFLSFGSVASLLAIAIDRYRKICKPFASQISIKVCRYVILFVTVLAVTLTAPSLAIHQVEQVNIERLGHNLTGHVCVRASGETLQSYTTAFQVTLFALFVTSVLILIVMYALIRKRLYRLPNLRSQTIQNKTRKSQGTILDTNVDSIIASSADDNSKSAVTDDRDHSVDDKNLASMSISDKVQTKDTESKNAMSAEEKKRKQTNANTRKYSIVMLAITVAFVLSYLPYLVLSAAATVFGSSWIEASKVGYVLYTIGIRSHLINSVCNPIIYGFFNTAFRSFVYLAFCRLRFCKSSKQPQIGSTDSDKSTVSAHTNIQTSV